MTEPASDSLIAIVGMSGRFPGAAGVGELWRNLVGGTGGLRDITDAELRAAGADPAEPGYVRVGGPVEGLELFDATAFGFSAREAETMEPHHRLMLECSWEALENAGYCPTDPGVPVGVFAGCAFPDYMTRNVPDLGAEPGGKQLLSAGVERDSLTSLVSYKLGLHGPSLTVQTYCSTSLVAVHLACQSLLTYECDMALAGGAFLPLPQPTGYRYEEGGILSPDGRVRSLDASANGTVMGSGAAVVTLKRLADALADGDVVHAVILGSAVNNDGRERAGYTAPGARGQAEVIETALAVAGVKPESVGYVECHAVGTPLGDSIELSALSRVFGTPRESPCVLSSVKPSVGHLDRAAGVTGLLRATLSLRNELLPATPGFQTPNPALAAASDRFTVLTENRAWPAGPDPRRAGVSSFGVGGTNAHVVLEQAPPRDARPGRPGPHLLTFSAGDPAALSALTDRLRGHLVDHPEDDLADVAYTLQVSRGRFALRRAVVCHDRDDAIAALADPSRWIDGETRRRDPRVRLVSAGGLSDLGRLGVRLSDDPDAVVVEPGDSLLATVARLWLAGSVIDWAALHDGEGRRVELPTYPFQRRRYWIDAQSAPGTYLPTWRRHPLPVADLDHRLRAAGPWLLFAGDEHVEALAARIVYAGGEVVTVRPGESFEAHETGDFTIQPGDVPELMRSLIVVPRMVVDGLGLASSLGQDSALVVLTSGAVGVLGSDLTHPEHAGRASSYRHVDMDAFADVDQVLAAVLASSEDSLAVRGDETWIRCRTPYELEPARLSARDTVLIVGDGSALARHLASEYGCRCVLASVAEVHDLAADVDVVVYVEDDSADAVRDFHALQAALGDEALDRRIALTSSATVQAYARVARLRGEGRWLVAGSAPVEAFGGLLGAVGHVAQVEFTAGSVAVHRVEPVAAAVDRARRPRPALATPFIEPADGLERTVANLLAEGLGLEELGADDNFFELGGRSAAAVQIAARLREDFSADLPLTALVEHPTPRLLATHLTTPSP